MNALPEKQAGPSPRCAQDIDRHIGARMLERRVMLGLTQQEMAELIGVTYQQAHNYEQGKNRITVGRLYMIAQALDVDVAFFFEGITSNTKVKSPQRLFIEFMRNVNSLPSRKQQEALCDLVRVVAGVVDEQPESPTLHTASNNRRLQTSGLELRAGAQPQSDHLKSC